MPITKNKVITESGSYPISDTNTRYLDNEGNHYVKDDNGQLHNYEAMTTQLPETTVTSTYSDLSRKPINLWTTREKLDNYLLYNNLRDYYRR